MLFKINICLQRQQMFNKIIIIIFLFLTRSFDKEYFKFNCRVR